MRDVVEHYRRRSGQRELASTFVATFGVLWLVVEPLGLFFPGTFKWGWSGYLGLLGASTVVALIRARPRSVVARELPPTDVHIEVRVGDLLAQEGNVVVGVPDTFDTDLSDGIISPESVQGQFLIEVFRGDRSELDRQIEEALPPSGVADTKKTFGKTTRFPVGTVAVVKRRGTRYFLTAFTKMSPTPPPNVSSSVEDLQVALARTWQMVLVAGNGEPVHVAVMGSHLARLGLSRTLLVQIMVLSYIASMRRGGAPSKLTVWIHPSDAHVVDMTMLDGWLRGLCAA